MENHPLCGRKQSPEHIEKRVAKLRGVCSEARRIAALRSGFRKGFVPWNSGKTGIFSEETKAQMREAKLKKAPPPHKAGCKCFRCDPKIGSLNHNWKDGSSKEIMRIRSEIREELTAWRRDVFIRDSFTCCMCHSTGGNLNAHHIKKFSDYPELRLDINNGVTLCKSCHVSVTNKEEEYENMFSDLLKLR